MRALGLLIALLLATPSSAQEAEHTPNGNEEMAAMFAADQAARRALTPDSDWQAIAAEDAKRRLRTRELLDAGLLTTGPDFYAAAFVFQHGSEPDDYLLAHSLAVRALGLGMKEAEWIAAATLDRYLQAVGQKQIYGTQYQRNQGEDWTQGEYDRDLLNDQLREGAGVESLEAQTAKVDRMNAPAQNED